MAVLQTAPLTTWVRRRANGLILAGDEGVNATRRSERATRASAACPAAAAGPSAPPPVGASLPSFDASRAPSCGARPRAAHGRYSLRLVHLPWDHLRTGIAR